ncbi:MULTISPECIES: hypothetical protein [Pseudomonadaceae]|jgi:hypothetical protein|uniref:Secreted protein n=2 Tax=Ectopseudomonas TaxID=3236654 RepID=A0A427HBB0_ECTOL|nr:MULTISPECIES: hypothetical protein [Pseudomonas]RRW31829.1 hypothetical protein EGJ44_18090 [Pseudomonas oleovorans]SUD37707.1 Uncharacterised protein [Pseudomonas mendocina]|tara:strand:+ start:15617 stop:15808 length:192 start_codon:yes stop_codon:yes gene_type:complete
MKVFSQFLLIVCLGAASIVASAEDGSERSLNAVKQFRENQQRIHGDKAVEERKSPSVQSEQSD